MLPSVYLALLPIPKPRSSITSARWPIRLVWPHRMGTFGLLFPCIPNISCTILLDEVVQHSLDNLGLIKTQRLSVEHAAKLPRRLGYTTTLRMAVACEFLHRGCGLPAIFVFDMFQACLASCQCKDLSIALYADKSMHFTCKARWWACPTRDPNAGKSPACALITKLFEETVSQHRSLFYPTDHFIGVGNNGKIQERLRKLEGVLLLWGPEAKPILDPSFPTKETVDVAKYLDLTRWLECANGGKSEWGTATEEKASSRGRPSANPALPPDQLMPPLVFGSTNVNICLSQQFSLFRKWLTKVEHLHQCGFGARILMSATGRPCHCRRRDRFIGFLGGLPFLPGQLAPCCQPLGPH